MNKRTRLLISLAVLTIVLGAVAALSATTFTGNTLIRQAWNHQKTGVTTTQEDFSGDAGRLLDWDHTSGTGANQMNQLFRESVTLTNGAARTIDLAGGVTNAFGDSVTFAEVRFFAVSLSSANSNAITVGNASANQFASWCGSATDTVTIRPGGLFLMVAPDSIGYVVSTNGNLKILNAGTNSVTYNLWIGGSDS